MREAPPASPKERYDADWVRRLSDGQNPLAQAAALAREIPLRPGDRVLDLGCGRAVSSIFFARELGARVWAADREVAPEENLRSIRQAECEDLVFPIRADARDLPFAAEYFDAAVAIDAYHYFGTDERYLPYLARFVKPGGHVAIADIAFSREIAGEDDAPPFLRAAFARHWSFVHTIDWWKSLWERTGRVDVVEARPLADSRKLLQDYVLDRAATDRNDEIARAAIEDGEGLIVLFLLVARKR
jgi:cyclopropane fatty-acyl-phospholipid synthase-like methyltransferase